MSRTLKRPMFRGGGKVNSVGTGITSGLADREPYAVGGTTLDPYVSGPFQPEPKKYYLNELFVPKIGSGIVEGQKASTLNFLNKTVPGIQKEGTTNSSFSLIPEAGASELPIETKSSKKPKEKEPEKELEKTPKDLDEPTPKDLDEIEYSEESLLSQAKAFEKVLGAKTNKEKIFDLMLAAAPGLLEGDYATALREGAGAIKDDTKQQARLLAVQDAIERGQIREKAVAAANTPSATSKTIADLYGVKSIQTAFEKNKEVEVPLNIGEVKYDAKNGVLKAKNQRGEEEYFDINIADGKGIEAAQQYARN